MRCLAAALAAALWVAGVPVAPALAGAQTVPQGDPLTAAARRAARAWERHDFAGLVAGSPGVMVRLGGTEPSAPLPPGQAALTLQAFAGGAEEVRTEVTTVREVDAGRAYAELQRAFVARGTSARRVQTLYLGWRRVRGADCLVEIRVVP